MDSGLPSLEGRTFRAVAEVDGGEVGTETTFHYLEEDGIVEGTYAGGVIVSGFLVGTRSGDTLDFRYCQLNSDGETSTGHCTATLSRLQDGRLRLDETWEWESRAGSGTSAVEEVT